MSNPKNTTPERNPETSPDEQGKTDAPFKPKDKKISHQPGYNKTVKDWEKRNQEKYPKLYPSDEPKGKK